MNRAFRLYPEERHWWSFNDYRAVLDTMRALTPARVLEFGPGSSTLALVEGGAAHVDTCEDDPDWAQVYEERLVTQFPDIVHLHRYTWRPDLSIPAIDGERYDLALIDGPRGTDRRPEVVRYALARCVAVLVPTEDLNRLFRQTLTAIAAERGWTITIRETGPLSGGFALFTRPAETHSGSVEVESAPVLLHGADDVVPRHPEHSEAPTRARRARRKSKTVAP